MSLDQTPDIMDAYCSKTGGVLWLYTANTDTIDAWGMGMFPHNDDVQAALKKTADLPLPILLTDTVLVGNPSWGCKDASGLPKPIYHRVEKSFIVESNKRGSIVELRVRPVNFTECFESLDARIEVSE